MPAIHDRYVWRNDKIGWVAVYHIGNSNPRLARIATPDGTPVKDGTRATIIDARDFDFPWLYELEDGRRTSVGGTGWHHFPTAEAADKVYPREEV